MLVSTEKYFKQKSQEWVSTDSTPDYMVKAERALKEEP